MKNTISIVLLIYALYIISKNYQSNKYSCVLIKSVGKNIPKYKEYLHAVRRKKKCSDSMKRIYNNNKTLLIWSILLLSCGDVEINPGPGPGTSSRWNCDWCSQKFGNHRTRLESHQKKSTRVSCNVCEGKFCFESRLQQHQRTEGHGLPTTKQTQRRLRSTTNKELTEQICQILVILIWQSTKNA